MGAVLNDLVPGPGVITPGRQWPGVGESDSLKGSEGGGCGLCVGRFYLASGPLEGGFFLGAGGGGDKPERSSQSDSTRPVRQTDARTPASSYVSPFRRNHPRLPNPQSQRPPPLVSLAITNFIPSGHSGLHPCSSTQARLPHPEEESSCTRAPGPMQSLLP